MLKFSIHYGIHSLLPLAIALWFYRPKALKVYLIFMATFIIDLDHLWATPIFSPNRCSINFHFMHSYLAIALYFGMLFYKPTRIIGIGLICHIIADSMDCLMMHYM